VTNTGNEPRSFLVQNQKLITRPGHEYAGFDMVAEVLGYPLTTVLKMNSGLSLKVPGTTQKP
jgi:hypothetical protein